MQIMMLSIDNVCDSSYEAFIHNVSGLLLSLKVL